MCINCQSGGFHQEQSLNKLSDNLVNEGWEQYIKSDYSGFTKNNRIDIHVSNDIPRKFKRFTKWTIRQIDKVTKYKIGMVKDKNDADIFVDDVDNYNQFGDGAKNAKGIAYINMNDGKLYATWLTDWNLINYNNGKRKPRVWSYTKRLITHEILHTLGLGHPYGDGNTEGITNVDTAMSYNHFDFSITKALRPADVTALQSIWG